MKYKISDTSVWSGKSEKQEMFSLVCVYTYTHILFVCFRLFLRYCPATEILPSYFKYTPHPKHCFDQFHSLAFLPEECDFTSTFLPLQHQKEMSLSYLNKTQVFQVQKGTCANNLEC